MSPSSTRFIALNATGFLGLLTAVLRRDGVYLIDVGNGMPMLRPIWRRIGAFLIRFGWVAPVHAAFPADQRYFVESWMPEHPNLFWSLESDIARRFDFGRFESLPGYTQALRHAACTYAHHKLRQVSLLHRLSRQYGNGVSVHGIDLPVLDWHNAAFGVPRCHVRALDTAGALRAAVVYLAIVFYAAAWLLRRVRRTATNAAPVLLGLDFTQDVRHTALVRAVLDREADALFVFRNRGQQAAAVGWPEMAGFASVYPEDIVVSPREAMTLWSVVVADGWRILRLCRQLPAELFFEAIKLPLRRIIFRGFFARHPVRYFLSKDDYNPEHAVRSDELRRAGAVSLGISHGMPTPGIVDPAVRYIDFDIYFTFGRYPYPEHYHDTWPRRMKTVAVGSYGMTPAQLQRLSPPRPPDIVCFLSRLVGEHEMYAEVQRLARAFPDRTVFVKAKYRPGGPYHFDYGALGGDPPNIVHTWDSPYELMLRCRYAVSNGSSTVAAEAIQFGLATWVLDSFDAETKFFYRHFSDLCVRSAGEVIGRIRALESGQDTYRHDLFKDLINLSGRPIHGMIREHLNLAPKHDRLPVAAQ